MTSDELEKRNIAKMGEALGKQYSALHNEVAILHLYWKEFLELFGTNQKRIDRLNQAAPGFFQMLQDELFQTNVLHLARLTDPPKSVGKDNLTLRNLPDLVTDKKLRDQLTALLDAAEKATSFCRDWRNRRFAHYALDLATNESKATALETVNKDKVNAALRSLADVLNAVERHYFQGGTVFEAVAGYNGAVALLYVLGDGIKRKQEREKLIESGKISEADLPELI
jgi:AbiU2